MIASQVQVNSAFVRPEVIVSAEKVNGKIARVVVQVHNILWNNVRVANTTRPPTITAQFDPDNVSIVQLLVLKTGAAVETLIFIKRVL